MEFPGTRINYMIILQLLNSTNSQTLICLRKTPVLTNLTSYEIQDGGGGDKGESRASCTMKHENNLIPAHQDLTCVRPLPKKKL